MTTHATTPTTSVSSSALAGLLGGPTQVVDQVVDLPLTRPVLEAVADPQQVHRILTSFLPDMAGRSSAIRADTATLARVDLPTDPLGAPGRVRLRLRGPAIEPTLGQASPLPVVAEGVRVVVTVAAQWRSTRPGSPDVRPVTDAEAQDWVSELLTRHGLHVTDLRVGPARAYGARTHEVRFTVRDIAATLTRPPATTTDAWVGDVHQVLTTGVGRGRAYALGMPVLVP